MGDDKKNSIKAHRAKQERKEQVASRISSVGNIRRQSGGEGSAGKTPRYANKASVNRPDLSRFENQQTNESHTRRNEENTVQSAAPMTEEERRRRAKRAAAKRKRRKKRQIQRIILIVAFLLILVLAFSLVRAMVKGISNHKEAKKKEAQAIELQTAEQEESKEAKAVITTAGDIIMHTPIFTSSLYTDGTNFDFNPIFEQVKSYYNAADFSVLTTEFSMTGSNYTGYPTFNSPDAIATALAENGIDMCLLANNHIYDSGDEGMMKTLEVYEKNNILHGGVRKSVDEKNYIVQEINGIKVGFFDYVYETEGGTINGIPVTDEGKQLLNSFDESNPQSLYDDIEKNMKEMEEEGVEYYIAYLHWGVEYQTKENELQDAIAQHLCDMGIDALIASHPHVIEPVDLLESADGNHKMVCCYAIGNHLSNQRTEYMDGIVNGYSEDGMMVTLTINRDKKGKITLESADFIPTWVYHDQENDDRYVILPLDKPDEIKKLEGFNSELSTDVDQSLARTESIVGEGVKKVQAALPLEQ